MGMDGLMRVLVIALLVLAGSLSGCEEVRMQQLDADMGRMQQELAAEYEGGRPASKFRTICVEGYRYLAMEEEYSQRSYGGLTQMWENTPYGPRPMMCRQPEETLRPDANPI